MHLPASWRAAISLPEKSHADGNDSTRQVTERRTHTQAGLP